VRITIFSRSIAFIVPLMPMCIGPRTPSTVVAMSTRANRICLKKVAGSAKIARDSIQVESQNNIERSALRIADERLQARPSLERATGPLGVIMFDDD
jgi:hypothetical protein